MTDGDPSSTCFENVVIPLPPPFASGLETGNGGDKVNSTDTRRQEDVFVIYSSCCLSILLGRIVHKCKIMGIFILKRFIYVNIVTCLLPNFYFSEQLPFK